MFHGVCDCVYKGHRALDAFSMVTYIFQGTPVLLEAYEQALEYVGNCCIDCSPSKYLSAATADRGKVEFPKVILGFVLDCELFGDINA